MSYNILNVIGEKKFEKLSIVSIWILNYGR